ncbi:E2F/DP family winged-helix DNA-binding domain-containing protein [Sporodiniella umbellata]|nr:E2F/DP family winged-helix DNA-binding domain-containing protein [Sporodiniella umbellata]
MLLSNRPSMFTSAPMSHHRSTLLDDPVELRPFMMNKKESFDYCLPPIHQVLTPISSPLTSEEEMEEDNQPRIVRKTSIASLLNSEPPLKRGRPRQAGILKRRTKEHDFLPRATKGLRHFSKQVCDKVAEKGMTTYNEVADELALDIQKSMTLASTACDQKNIRRRVYDALNVLMAMNIITKDKKVIQWLGIPACYSQQRSQNDLLRQIKHEQEKQIQMIQSLDLLKSTVNEKISQHGQIKTNVWKQQLHTTH